MWSSRAPTHNRYSIRDEAAQLRRPSIGIGAARKTAAVRWNVASDVVVAWIVTLPAAALFGAAFYELYKFLS